MATNRLVKYWTTAAELPGIVSLSLSKTIKMFPAIGWARANLIGSQELLADINELRKENTELRRQVAELTQKPTIEIDNLAEL